MKGNTICVVAILKDEEPFLDEWLLYHKMLGIDHFFLYDDHPDLPLHNFLSPHHDYVTVIPWHGLDKSFQGRNNQTKAYCHARDNHIQPYKWATFIDGDEFVVLRKKNNIPEFLSDFDDVSAVTLNWHVFGHNGFYDDPPGLITSQLVRRMFLPNKNVKTFTRVKAIATITSPHFCRLQYGLMVDANHKPFTDVLYEGRTDAAHINHYQCRSFKRWMNRVERGNACMDDILKDSEKWRYDKELCLKQFVTTVALNKNEFIDTYMLKYKPELEKAISALNRSVP